MGHILHRCLRKVFGKHFLAERIILFSDIVVVEMLENDEREFE